MAACVCGRWQTLDVSLYGCSIKDVAAAVIAHGRQGGSISSPCSPAQSQPSSAGSGLHMILSPHQSEEEEADGAVSPTPPTPSSASSASSSRGDDPPVAPQPTTPSRSPQFVYRHSSSPLEAANTSIVVNHLTLLVRFTPLLRIYHFFTDLGPDPLDQHDM